MKRKTVWLLWAGFILGPGALLAQTQPIHYQARIQNASAQEVNGPVTIGFRIYGTSSGSTVLWSETQALIASQGIISVDLGAVNPLPADLLRHPPLYLGLTVAGDPEMVPRRLLESTWKAINSDKAAGQAVQAGEATLTVSASSSGSAAVTFPRAFQSPPRVLVGAPRQAIGNVSFISTRVTEVTPNGCTIVFQSLSGAVATGSTTFDWIAMGE